MADARLPDELINLALEMRRDYAAEVRTPRYMEGDRIADLQARVKSEALSLRASLVAGELDLSGAEFHSLCLARMSEIGTSTEEQVDVSGFVKGCLYDIAERCLMRFAPPTPRGDRSTASAPYRPDCPSPPRTFWSSMPRDYCC